MKRPALGLLGLERAAERLAEVDATLEAGIGQPAVELLHVARDRLADEGVQAGGDHALVLADHRIQLGRDAQEQVRECLAHDLPGARLVGGVEERPEVTDGERLDALVLDQPAHALDHLLLVERHDDIAVDVDALVDLGDQAARHELRHRRLHERVDRRDARRARDPERVAEPLGHQQAGAPALHLGDRVRDHGRADRQQVGLAQQLAALGPGRLGEPLERVHDPVDVRARRGRGLAPDHGPVRGHADRVGERPAYVDPDELRLHLLPRGQMRRIPVGGGRSAARATSSPCASAAASSAALIAFDRLELAPGLVEGGEALVQLRQRGALAGQRVRRRRRRRIVPAQRGLEHAVLVLERLEHALPHRRQVGEHRGDAVELGAHALVLDVLAHGPGQHRARLLEQAPEVVIEHASPAPRRPCAGRARRWRAGTSNSRARS